MMNPMATPMKTLFLKTGMKYVELSGESTETKPTEGIAYGSYFLENDTGDLYYLSKEGEWEIFGGES